MEQNFTLQTQARANYYTAGSPVQFVRVELLKGEITGEVAVCLTFKNIGVEPLTGLVIHFKCKDASNQILCEDDFYYEQLNVAPGGLFGSDDAVYVSDRAIARVEIEQDRAFINGRGVDLRGYQRVRLESPRLLPNSIARTLQERTGNPSLVGVPQDTAQGWFCACGAFHPKEENARTCSECGSDRAFVRSTLTHILEEARQAAERQQREINAAVDPAAAMAAAAQAAIDREENIPAPAPTPQQPRPAQAAAQPVQPAEEAYTEDVEAARVQKYAKGKARLFEDEEDTEDSTREYRADDADAYDTDDEDDDTYAEERGRYAEEGESGNDVMAERIIRWAPPITAILCAVIVAVSLIYHFVIL